MEDFTAQNLRAVREEIKSENRHLSWECSADGFYQIRGHYSPNCSVALYDLGTGKVAFAHHSCKKGAFANFHGFVYSQTLTIGAQQISEIIIKKVLQKQWKGN